MGHEESYTTEDIARLLKVSKLTVYDLIKKGELQAYRVGRQMRIDCSELSQYKERSREANFRPTENMRNAPVHQKEIDKTQIVISGQDRSLDLLAHRLEDCDKAYQPLRSQRGSLDGLIAMYEGNAQIVSTHLFDGDTFEYNIPYVRKLLVSKSFIVVRFISRIAGLYTAKGNPYKLTHWRDLAQPGLRLINRESGAGARVLLDEQLRLHQIKRTEIRGYEDEENSHLAIASAVASGRADVGIGIEQTANLANIDFIPLITESYDLVMLKTNVDATLIEGVLCILKEKEFQTELNALGYDADGIGEVLYEQ